MHSAKQTVKTAGLDEFQKQRIALTTQLALQHCVDLKQQLGGYKRDEKLFLLLFSDVSCNVEIAVLSQFSHFCLEKEL